MKKLPILFIVSALWLLYTAFLVLSGTKLPGTDVFIFKEAGVNLALKGNFVISNLPYAPFDQEYTYYFYPPLYPFLYGVWTKITGFGYSQGVLFDCLIRLIRTLLLASFLWKPLKRISTRRYFIFLICLLGLSFITSDADRPDELAAVFGFASWYVLFRAGSFNKILCGVLIGLCGSTSLTGGVFFAIGAMAYLWPWSKNIKGIATVAVLALGVFLAIVAPIFIRDPFLLKMFSKQASISNFSYIRQFDGLSNLIHFLVGWVKTWAISMNVALSTVFAASVLLIVAVWLVLNKKIERDLRAFYISATAMYLLVAIVWILQPYYLWFSYLSLFVFIGSYSLRRYSNILMCFLILSLSPKMLEEAKSFLNSIQIPKSESVWEVNKALKNQIPIGSKVAVNPDQFYALGREYNVFNLSYVCMHVETYDYIYVSRMSNAKQASPIPNPCVTRSACFEVISNTSADKKFTLLGADSDYYLRTSGGTLYKNTKCKGLNIPFHIKAEEWLQKKSQ